MASEWLAVVLRKMLPRSLASVVVGLVAASVLPTLAGAAPVSSATVNLSVEPGGSVLASWTSTSRVAEQETFANTTGTATETFAFSAKGHSAVSLSETPAAQFSFTGWSGAVSGTKTSTSFKVVAKRTYAVTAAFGPAPTTYDVTFNESGLSDQQWSVDLNGATSSASSANITFTNLSSGSYPYSVTPPSGYAASPPSGSVSVTGANQSVSLSFALSAQQQAVAAYQALQKNLYVPSVGLYRGTSADGCTPYSCLWPFTNAMAATEYLYASPGGSSYGPDVAARVVGLQDYSDTHEVSPSGASQPDAFESEAPPPHGSGGSTYYDDNGWSTLDLIDAYQLTGNPNDLTLAQNTFDFVVTGWDNSSTDPCPGGLFWEDVAGSQRSTTANAANAEAGLELYQLTQNSSDLSWAEQIYQWVDTCLETPTGLYNDHVNANGSVNTAMWSYNQGTMIGAGVLLYEITSNSSYLTAAERTAQASVSYFGTGATLQNQGPAFNAIYFRNLFVLGQIQPNSAYTAEAQAYASFMWTQRDASTGLFLQNGQTNGVNGTAPMVEIYSLLAGSVPRP